MDNDDITIKDLEKDESYDKEEQYENEDDYIIKQQCEKNNKNSTVTEYDPRDLPQNQKTEDEKEEDYVSYVSQVSQKRGINLPKTE